MPFVEQISSFQFVAVIIVLAVLLMVANSILSLRQKLKPKEDNATIIRKLTALTTRFDELDRRCTKIENTCTVCKKDYGEDLEKIYGRLNPLDSKVSGIDAKLDSKFELLEKMLVEALK